jgi:hemolysin D
LPSSDKGFVRTGQDVDIKFDAFPFQIYGKPRGKLIWLSPDAEEVRSAFTDSNRPAHFAYRAKIKLITLPENFQITPGMTVKADIITDKRKIINFFLFPLVDSVETGFRVR